ncbi:MAG: hypothetical protein J5854_00310 [Clostridia bacterium]|nr:hypothetical protein [Clostridia bacterium]
MKRFIAIFLILLSAVSLASGCQKPVEPDDPPIVDIYTPVPYATPVPTPELTMPVSPTSEPPATDTPDPTATPYQADPTVFDDAVFIGNSILHGLFSYGIITHGKFLTKTSLNVNSVFTSYIDGSSVPVIDELNSGRYGKVILCFGTNELGWPSLSVFSEKYEKLIDAIRQRQPGCKIYILEVLPVSKAKSDKNENGVTLENVKRINEVIRVLCEAKDVTLIKVPESFYDSEGYLPADASSDGVHPKLDYYRVWAEHICLWIMGVRQ